MSPNILYVTAYISSLVKPPNLPKLESRVILLPASRTRNRYYEFGGRLQRRQSCVPSGPNGSRDNDVQAGPRSSRRDLHNPGRSVSSTKPFLPFLLSLTPSSGRETAPDKVTFDDFDSYLSAAAEKISPFDYEIRSTLHQITKERVHAIVNATSDPITQIATARTTEEMFYVRRIIDAMFETYNTRRREVMGVTSMQALERKVTKGVASRQSLDNSQTVDKGVTNDQAEKTLNGLVAEGWFERSKEGWYTLSPRALLELQTWLVNEYNDEDAEGDDWQRIKFCEACKGMITVGKRCADLDCNVRLHDICEEAFFNSRPGNKCPKCETPWDGKHFVGQRAITSTEEYLKGKRRSGGTMKTQAEEEGEEDVDEDE